MFFCGRSHNSKALLGNLPWATGKDECDDATACQIEIKKTLSKEGAKAAKQKFGVASSLALWH